MRPSDDQPDVRRKVSERLQRVRADGHAPALTTAEVAASHRRYRRLLLLAGVVVVLLALLGAWLQVARPPRALSRAVLADGLRLRLLEVTPRGPYAFHYRPPSNPLRAAAQRLGLPVGPPEITARPDLPDDSLVVWIMASRPVDPPDQVTFVDDEHRRYVDQEHLHPLEVGSQRWGRGTLLWIALTNYDRTAQRFTLDLSYGAAQGATFSLTGPALPPAALAAQSDYPLSTGGRLATIQLHQLRRVDPGSMPELLTLAEVPEPHDQLLLADFGVVEHTVPVEPGTWTVEVTAAETDHRERLSRFYQRHGLAFLTNGRSPAGLQTVRLDLAATKRIKGRAGLVFRELELPTRPGGTASWARPSARDPFASGRVVCLEGKRVGPNELEVKLEATAPTGSELTLSYQAGLDQTGRALRLKPNTTVELLRTQSTADSTTWHWTAEVLIEPDATALALAFKVAYQAVAYRVTGSLNAAVQPPRGPHDLAGLGLLLNQSPDGSTRIDSVVSGSAAADSALQVGDRVRSIEELPPDQLLRVLLRHRPGDYLTLEVLRDGQPQKLKVKLDPLTPPAGPEAADGGDKA